MDSFDPFLLKESNFSQSLSVFGHNYVDFCEISHLKPPPHLMQLLLISEPVPLCPLLAGQQKLFEQMFDCKSKVAYKEQSGCLDRLHPLSTVLLNIECCF